MTRNPAKNIYNLEAIFRRALEGVPPDEEEVRFLLELDDPGDRARLFQTARILRRRHFGDRVFLYGFLYFSTFCRNNCRFCQFRRDNTPLVRTRKTPGEILSAARQIAGSGVHLVDLTMGEDPYYFHRGEEGFSDLVDLVRRVRRETGLPVMISPGVVPEDVLARFAEAGADWYACYQETYNRALFEELRIGQSFRERMERKRGGGRTALLLEEGLLCGTGGKHPQTSPVPYPPCGPGIPTRCVP